MNVKVIIALGANMADPAKNLNLALHALEAVLGPLMRCSSVYQSEPIDMPEDAAVFLNAVVVGETNLAAMALLDRMQQIELDLGRALDHGYHESRTIDLDMLTYGEQMIASRHLTVPHPSIKQRLFVLKPLAEICPGLILPGEVLSVSELIEHAPPMVIKRLPTPLRAHGPP